MGGAVLDTLRKACAGHAREADDADTVGGRPPSYVASPIDTAETADLLRAAAEHGLRVVARGAGTKLGWGAPPSGLDLVVDTSRMNRVVEHAAGDLVVHVQAGTRLSALAERLARAEQRLALDPPFPDATIGGTVATGTSGPLRLHFGGPRDLLIGTTVVRADGVVARTGGRVVKNVAGYDLGKLLSGSFGTLGLITECMLRLHPAPAARGFLLRQCPDENAADEAVRWVRRSQLVPSALELDWPDGGGPLTVGVLIEGTDAGVRSRVGQLTDAGWAPVDAAPAWWGAHPARFDGTAVKVTFALSALAPVLTALRRLAGDAVVLRGQAGAGVLVAGVPAGADPGEVAAFVAGTREAVSAYDGAVVVLHAPDGVRAAVGDVWGPVRGLDVMRRVKNQFDPEHRLAPGRFVGGI